MNIVCDTNIWYDAVMGKVELSKKHSLIIPILVVEELSITNKIDTDPRLVKEVVRVMMRKNGEISNTIVNQSLPFFNLFHINNPTPPVLDKAQEFLEFTRKLANELDTPEFIDATREYRIERNKAYDELVITINDLALGIKLKITDKEAHLKYDATKDHIELIKDWTLNITENNIPEDFEWSQIELFLAVMNVYFKKLETGEYQMAQNDIFDFFMLLYVQPGSIYWTRDKKWFNLIMEAGMEKYLFKEE